MLDDFVQAVVKQSPKILDNIGIRTDIASLPSYPLYAYARDRKYGCGWLSRFWCARIRPRLMPERQAAVDAIWEDAKYHARLDFMSACLRQNQD